MASDFLLGKKRVSHKKFTKVLLHTAKMIDPSVKCQARGQNNRSRAARLDINHGKRYPSGLSHF